MTEQDARRIAEEELRRINAVMGLDVKIDSAAEVHGVWTFATTGLGAGPDRPMHLNVIVVDSDGRVSTGLTAQRSAEQRAKFRTSLANAEDLQALIPRSKFDSDRFDEVIARGYPAVAPILPELLRWLQDMNWPNAPRLARFAASIGAPLAPYLRTIFAGDDLVWKYWLISHVIGSNPDLFDLFKDDLKRIANNPTPEERREELDEQAREVLESPPTKN